MVAWVWMEACTVSRMRVPSTVSVAHVCMHAGMEAFAGKLNQGNPLVVQSSFGIANTYWNMTFDSFVRTSADSVALIIPTLLRRLSCRPL